MKPHVAANLDLPLNFGIYILSATTPFGPEHLEDLRQDAPAVLADLIPEYETLYRAKGWRMAPSIDRVYVNARAREVLGWQPRFDFRHVLARLNQGKALLSNLAREVGAKGYHGKTYAEGPYPIEPDGTGAL